MGGRISLKMRFFLFLSPGGGGVGARNAGKRVALSHALPDYVPRIAEQCGALEKANTVPPYY